MAQTNKSVESQLCDALQLKRCVSLKIEASAIGGVLVTSVQYLTAQEFHPLDKVLRKCRLVLLDEELLPTPDVEVFADGRVHTFRLPAHSPECPST